MKQSLLLLTIVVLLLMANCRGNNESPTGEKNKVDTTAIAHLPAMAEKLSARISEIGDSSLVCDFNEFVGLITAKVCLADSLIFQSQHMISVRDSLISNQEILISNMEKISTCHLEVISIVDQELQAIIIEFFNGEKLQAMRRSQELSEAVRNYCSSN